MAAATAQLASFETGHGDMVHDAAFDYYGKRLATCSSDRAIKVFDVVGEQVRGGVGRGLDNTRRQPLPAAAATAAVGWLFCPRVRERLPQAPPWHIVAKPISALHAAGDPPGRPERARGPGMAGGLGPPQVWQPAGLLLL